MTRACSVLAAVLGLMVLVPAATADAGVNVAAKEGQSFSGDVVTGLSCQLMSATITWGDGTTSAGTADGSAGIQGTHTYAEEGTSGGSVSYSYVPTSVCSDGTQTASFQATVQDAPLSADGATLSGTVGQSVSSDVGHFTDANPAAGAGEFSAQINWGDGSSSPGTVTAGPGGGFDVSGAHTYNTVGSYTITSTIVDIGGSQTTASSSVQVTVVTGPQARFGFAPFSPCQNDKVSFDASSSTGRGGEPITNYHWSIAESAFAPTQFTSAKPTLTHVFPAASYSVGPYQGPLPNKDLNDYHFFRPPATVALTVTDGAGTTATVSRTITFVDPDELLVGETGINPKTGLPFLSLFRDSRFSDVVPCQARSLDPKSTVVKLARPTFPGVASLRHSGASRVSVVFKPRCPPGLVLCSGELVLRPRTRTGRHITISGTAVHAALAGSLGHATFSISAGRSATVIVSLNARGRTLARAHRLDRVTIGVLTSGSHGGVTLASRTIIIVS